MNNQTKTVWNCLILTFSSNWCVCLNEFLLHLMCSTCSRHVHMWQVCINYCIVNVYCIHLYVQLNLYWGQHLLSDHYWIIQYIISKLHWYTSIWRPLVYRDHMHLILDSLLVFIHRFPCIFNSIHFHMILKCIDRGICVYCTCVA